MSIDDEQVKQHSTYWNEVVAYMKHYSLEMFNILDNDWWRRYCSRYIPCRCPQPASPEPKSLAMGWYCHIILYSSIEACVKCLGLISSRNFLRSNLVRPWIVRCLSWLDPRRLTGLMDPPTSCSFDGGQDLSESKKTISPLCLNRIVKEISASHS